MKKLKSIQALRFVAAFAVLAGHLGYHALFPGNSHPALKVLRSVTDMFVFAGVDMFFIISGAIMYLVTRGTVGQASGPRTLEFIFRRGARIYPAFWISALLGVFIFTGSAFDPLVLAQQVALLNTPLFQPAAWTMVYEVRFYLMVALVLLFAGRKLDLGFGVWAVLLSVAVILRAYGILPADAATDLLMLEFMIGVGVGALISREIFVFPLWMVTAGVVGFTLTTVYLFPNNMNGWRVYGYGLPMAAILYGAVGLEHHGLQVPGLMSFLGDISYSLYLWHLPIALLLRPLVPSGGLAAGLFYIVICTAVSLAVACASFLLIERPVARWAYGHSMTRGWGVPKPV